MQAPQPKGMSLSAYLAWEETQAEKHELVDGAPVARQTRLMAGGTRRHALIAVNIAASLRGRLRGGPWAPYGSDLKVASPTGSVRYPDVTVDCGPGNGRELIAADPRVVFEVLSASNDTLRQTRLLHDYQSMPSLMHIVLVSQEAALVQLWSREAAGWSTVEITAIDGEAPLAAIETTLPLSEIYEGVSFDPAEN